jgi:hypothetical protein
LPSRPGRRTVVRPGRSDDPPFSRGWGAPAIGEPSHHLRPAGPPHMPSSPTRRAVAKQARDRGAHPSSARRSASAEAPLTTTARLPATPPRCSRHAQTREPADRHRPGFPRDLEVDDILGGQAGDRRGADVLDSEHSITELSRQRGRQLLELARPGSGRSPRWRRRPCPKCRHTGWLLSQTVVEAEISAFPVGESPMAVRHPASNPSRTNQAGLSMTPQEVTKEKAERWTRRRAFVQVRNGPNIQLLPFPLVC